MLVFFVKKVVNVIVFIVIFNVLFLINDCDVRRILDFFRLIFNGFDFSFIFVINQRYDFGYVVEVLVFLFVNKGGRECGCFIV